MLKITKYVLIDILRNRILLMYAVFLLIISLSLFSLEEDPAKAVISLLSVVLIILPLVGLIFSTTYFYNAYEFLELLLAQPLKRNTILLAQYIGVATCLVLAFLFGVGIPVLIYYPNEIGAVLVFAGVMLSLCFAAFAFLASVSTRDKARGIGLSLLFWFYLAIMYDAIVVGIMYAFSDYPLEKIVVLFAALNPIDLARITVLLKLDISAMMGYTGAIYQDFFGNWKGIVFTSLVMAIWVVLPLWMSVRIFNKKNI